MIYIYSWLLYVKNDKFKHTTTSQRLAFNYFILTFSFSLSIFKLWHTKKHQVYNLCYFEFLLRNLLHSVRNMNLVTFLIGLFLLLFPVRNVNDKVRDKDTFDVVLDIVNFEHISLLVTVFLLLTFLVFLLFYQLIAGWVCCLLVWPFVSAGINLGNVSIYGKTR